MHDRYFPEVEEPEELEEVEVFGCDEGIWAATIGHAGKEYVVLEAGDNDSVWLSCSAARKLAAWLVRAADCVERRNA